MKKFMQLPDDCMRMYFELLTDLELDEVDRLLAGHPKAAKIRLAREIITQYHGAEQADEAAARWQREIAEKSLPQEIPTVVLSRHKLTDGTMQAAFLLKATGLCSSTSEARRAIAQGGAYLGEQKERIERFDQPIRVEPGLLLWVGKKRFCRVELVD